MRNTSIENWSVRGDGRWKGEEGTGLRLLVVSCARRSEHQHGSGSVRGGGRLEVGEGTSCACWCGLLGAAMRAPATRDVTRRKALVVPVV